ncbi:YybH family protein [Psychroserpens sp. BH13MA-6]
MKKLSLILIVPFLLISCNQNPDPFDHSNDIESIKKSIDNYDKGWDSKDLELVLNEYSEDIDWTNAFGDRVQGKKELKSLLKTIFSLDFVMSGKNNYKEPEIEFLSEDIALVRSVNIRTNQKWPDGRDMDDRIINHLRVFKRIDNKWLCINHMISQAHNKQGK